MNQHDSTNPRTWKGGFGLKRKLTSIVGAMLATATLLGGMVLPAQASMVDSVTTDPNAGIMPVDGCADSGVTSPVTSISVAAIDFWGGLDWQTATAKPIPASYSSPSVNSQNNVRISMFCNNTRFAINRGGDDWRGNGSANLYFTMNDDYWVVLAVGDKSNSDPSGRNPYPRWVRVVHSKCIKAIRALPHCCLILDLQSNLGTLMIFVVKRLSLVMGIPLTRIISEKISEALEFSSSEIHRLKMLRMSR